MQLGLSGITSLNFNFPVLPVAKTGRCCAFLLGSLKWLRVKAQNLSCQIAPSLLQWWLMPARTALMLCFNPFHSESPIKKDAAALGFLQAMALPVESRTWMPDKSAWLPSVMQKGAVTLQASEQESLAKHYAARILMLLMPQHGICQSSSGQRLAWEVLPGSNAQLITRQMPSMAAKGGRRDVRTRSFFSCSLFDGRLRIDSQHMHSLHSIYWRGCQ